MLFMYLCEVAIVSQLCIFPLYLLHGLREDYLTCDIAFNAVMPLSRASTRGRYSRIEGVTPSLAEVMLEAEHNRRDTNRLLERIEQNTARQQRINSVSINDFVKLYPPKFNHSIEPLDEDDWLRSIAHKLRSANIAEDDKVTFAAYHLEGPTSLWWENYEAMRPVGQITTWADFSAAFHEHHIPEGLMDRKREEFCNFTHGRLTVDAYSREFGKLARYAPEEVSTDAKKQARFRKGLSPEVRRDLRLHDCTSFPRLVNKAISAETG